MNGANVTLVIGLVPGLLFLIAFFKFLALCDRVQKLTDFVAHLRFVPLPGGGRVLLTCPANLASSPTDAPAPDAAGPGTASG